MKNAELASTFTGGVNNGDGGVWVNAEFYHID